MGTWDTDALMFAIFLPVAFFLSFGSLFSIIGLVSLTDIWKIMRNDGLKTQKLKKLVLKIGEAQKRFSKGKTGYKMFFFFRVILLLLHRDHGGLPRLPHVPPSKSLRVDGLLARSDMPGSGL